MNCIARLRQFSKTRLPLILGLYIILQPLLDALTAFGALAEHPVTAGVLVRTVFMVLTFLYVVFVSRFEGKKWCLAFLGALIAYLALFMIYMFSLGGLSLCLANLKDLIKVYFAPFVLVFLYAIYREYGAQISTRALAVSGGIYAFVILLAFLTGTSFVSYGNSGYGYKGWFYAANEISCIIALTAPITIYYCLKQARTVTRKTWWKGVVIAIALISVAFSANFIGTKIVFAITLVYCLIAFVWTLVRYVQERTREARFRAITFGVLCILIFGMYFISPLQSYLNNIYMGIINEDPELILVSWGEDIQRASEGTWLKELISSNDAVKRLDQILSRRLLSASPSVQVFTEGGLAAKLLGIGYADCAAYSREIHFMVEMDPFSILVRQGILGFLLYYVPYLAAVLYLIVQFFRRPLKRLASLEYCSYLYSALAAFAISAIAGHALVSPAVSTFILAVTFRAWSMTREQNRQLPSK